MARAITLHGPIVGARFKKPAKKKPVGKQEETEAERQRRLANQSAATQIATTGIRAGRGVPREILDTATGASGKGSTAVQRERDRSTILSSRRKERSAATAERLQRQRQAQQEGAGRRKSQQADIAEQASRGVLPRAAVQLEGGKHRAFEIGKDVSGFQRGDVIAPDAARRYGGLLDESAQSQATSLVDEQQARIRGLRETQDAIDKQRKRLLEGRVPDPQAGLGDRPFGETLTERGATASNVERERRLQATERDARRAAGTGTELDRFGPTDEGQVQRLGELQLETSETILAQLPPERQTVMREIAATARSIRTGLAQSGIVGKDADSIIRKHLQGDFQNETGYSNSDVKFYLDNEASIQQGATPLDVDVGTARATIQPTDPGLPGIGQRRNALGQADASNTMAPIPTDEQIGSFRRDEDMLFQEDPADRDLRRKDLQSKIAGQEAATAGTAAATGIAKGADRDERVASIREIPAPIIRNTGIFGTGEPDEASFDETAEHINEIITAAPTPEERRELALAIRRLPWWAKFERDALSIDPEAARRGLPGRLMTVGKQIVSFVNQSAGI